MNEFWKLALHFSLADNFRAKVVGANDRYHIVRYNNESIKLQPAIGGPENCHQAIPVSSTATVWVAEYKSSGSSLSAIKLFTTNSSGTKWYLRVPILNFNGEQPDLVCPDHKSHVSINQSMTKIASYCHGQATFTASILYTIILCATDKVLELKSMCVANKIIKFVGVCRLIKVMGQLSLGMFITPLRNHTLDP